MAARSNPRQEPYRGVFVTASPTLKEQVQAAFTKLQVGTASGLCAFGPQTLLKHGSHPFVLQPPAASYNMIGGSAVLLMSLILLIRATPDVDGGSRLCGQSWTGFPAHAALTECRQICLQFACAHDDGGRPCPTVCACFLPDARNPHSPFVLS